MTSKTLGKSISEVEISHIDMHGIWLCVNDKEYFLPYGDFPWFKQATIGDIFSVELHHQTHLYWPKLDIDLTLDILASPEAYPLIYDSPEKR